MQRVLVCAKNYKTSLNSSAKGGNLNVVLERDCSCDLYAYNVIYFTKINKISERKMQTKEINGRDHHDWVPKLEAVIKY